MQPDGDLIVTYQQFLFFRVKNHFFGAFFKLIPLIFAIRKKTPVELVAQLVEQYTFNVWALGSSPSQFTN